MSLCAGDLSVQADSVQMEQILMNLVTNARDAMPRGGLVVIETSVFEISEEFVRTHAYGRPGSYALIAVSDTGEGMSTETRMKIFEPFFTTKEVGKGTGLGLAMVYGIIKQHKGYINVYSEPGKGSTFIVYLPLVAGATLESVNGSSVAAPVVGGETVLLAEDDQVVRNLMKMVLDNFAYRVIEAVDGEDAVRKFKERSAAVDLLVFDIIMPVKNGREAYQEIRQLQPGIQVLFTSGYTADIIQRKGIIDTGLDFVLKPISPTLFLQKVREILDRGK